MGQEVKIFCCDKHGLLVNMLANTDEPCCCTGDELKEMKPNTSEGAEEKHLPVVTQNGNQVTVEVGSIYHPMTEEHSIGLVYLETCCGGQYKLLKPDNEPKAVFILADGETAKAAYAYCNLHGLWKTEL